jgi:hypothetical protein
MEENNYSVIIQSLEKHLSERIEKLWRVFSWTSSILIAIAGGMIILGKKERLRFDTHELILISSIILILTLYAYLWINENLKLESKIRNQMDLIFEKQMSYSELKEIRPDKAIFGYKVVILLLGLTAVIATWISYLE